MQVLGWSMWFSDYLFLERNWAKDEAALKVYLNKFFLFNMQLNIQYTIFHISVLFIYFVTFMWQSSFKQLDQIPVPFWLALFVEGTRFTQTKLLAAQEFAVSKGLPIPRNVLVPRTKVNKVDA